MFFCFIIFVCHILETLLLKSDNEFWFKLGNMNTIINTILITPKSIFSNLWFLPCLLGADILIYYVYKYVKNKKMCKILCIVPGLIVLFFRIRVNMPFSLCTIMVSTMYIYIGYEMKAYTKCKIKNRGIIYGILYLVIMICEIKRFGYDFKQVFYNLDITYPILFFITSILGSLTVMEVCKKITTNKLLSKIGENTLYIYGLHFIAQNIIQLTLFRVPYVRKYDAVFLIISTILNLLICFICIKTLEFIKEFIKKIMEGKMSEKKLNGTVIVTYRCNARCTMCNRYKAPSKPDEEISIGTIKKLPKMYFTNITGGEPFIREDLADIVRELQNGGAAAETPVAVIHGTSDGSSRAAYGTLLTIEKEVQEKQIPMPAVIVVGDTVRLPE